MSDEQNALQLITHRSSLELYWGGRIRTCECRFQRPVPYHLATPQSRFSGPAAGSENRRRAPESAQVLGPRQRGAREDLPAALGLQNFARARRFPLAFKDSEDARTTAREN